MLKRMMITVLFFLAGMAFPSVLSNLAAGLAEKAFVKMPANASLTNMTMDYSLTYWTNSGVWNPIAKRMEWMGGPGTCCANPAWFRMIYYTESTDTWSIAQTPFSGSGHGYDGNALNPVTGLHYFGQKDQLQVRVWNGTSFSLLPAAPLSTVTTPSLTWFPDMNAGAGGLLYMGDAGTLAWYSGTKWTTITGVSVTSYDNFSEYNPVNKVVWLGSASGSYRLSANLTLTKLAAAPFSLEGNACALHACDPVSGKYIVTNLANSTWWEFDIMADTWTQITGQAGKPNFGTNCGGNGNNQFQAVIPDYGVIMYFDHNTTPPSVYLYKHKNGAAVENAALISSMKPGLEICPDPVRSVARIAAPGATVSLFVYDLSGRLVRDLSSCLRGGIATWNAASLPAGVYTVRAWAKDAVFSKRIAVVK
jgi:hypothetical protein